jgi:hypothetical protein
MRLPWFRRQHKEPAHPSPIQSPPPAADPTPMAPTIDLTRSRRVFYRTVESTRRPACPRCKSTLSPETGVYVVTTWQGVRQGDDFVISGDFGFYCPSCPTVVIDPGQLGHMLRAGAYKWDVGDAFMVRGLMALEAIPEAQRDVPFDELDAVPLVPFEPATDLDGLRKRDAEKSNRSVENVADPCC